MKETRNTAQNGLETILSNSSDVTFFTGLV